MTRRVVAPIVAAAALITGLCGTAFAQGNQSAGRERETGSSPADASTPEAPAALPPFIPALTDEDRRAAFPDVDGHPAHDNALRYFVLFDQLEWRAGETRVFDLDGTAWIGRDRDRLWLRTEGVAVDRRVRDAQVQALYGRQFARWWDVVAGVRQDVRPGPAQAWAAIGVQGLAPYWFQVEATGYVGASGRTEARFGVEYQLLITNRLILQPRMDATFAGKSDTTRSIGAGLVTTDVGLRVRYEWRREIAPYVGVTWERPWGTTRDLMRSAGDQIGGPRLAAGLRLWF